MEILLMAVLMVVALAFGIIYSKKMMMSDDDLRRAAVVRKVSAQDPDASWDHSGPDTEIDGLRLRFRHDDDPRAEVLMLAPEWCGAPLPDPRQDVERTIVLSDRPETHAFGWKGWGVRIRLRASGPLVGARVELRLDFAGGDFIGAGLEPDDRYPVDSEAWIEVEEVELLKAR